LTDYSQGDGGEGGRERGRERGSNFQELSQLLKAAANSDHHPALMAVLRWIMQILLTVQSGSAIITGVNRMRHHD